jgi:hypothetical protein
MAESATLADRCLREIRTVSYLLHPHELDEFGLESALSRYYMASGGPADPQSWNRYTYTRGDPVNRVDLTGMDDEPTCTVGSSDWCITGTGSGSSGNGDGSGQGGGGFGGAGSAFPSSGSCASMTLTGYILCMQSTQSKTTINKVSNLSTTSAQAIAIQNDLRWLEQAIAGDPTCSKWLGSSVSSDIEYMLGNNPGGQMMVGVGSFSDNGTNAVAGTNGTNMTPGSMLITINTNGAFFNSSAGVGYGVPSWIQAASAAEQGLILLHELAHLVEAAEFVQNDGPLNNPNYVNNQKTNNQLVMQNCGSIINSLGGK